MSKTFLYARVSTTDQTIDHQKTHAEAAGFTEIELLREEGRSGKSIQGRPVLREALDRLDRGDAGAIFVTRIDRLARSTKDFLSIVDRANANGWRIVMLDLNLDTATYQGRFVVTVMSALAEMERAIIAERQKDVHKDRREKGLKWGVDLGPKPKIDSKLYETLKIYRSKGMSYKAIADRLNKDGVKTALNKKWHPTTVKNYLDKKE
jgi:site-specific DNA recombinase